MTNLVTTLTGALQSQLVGGGLILMVTGAVMALLRQLPGKIMVFVRRQIIVEVDILDREDAFHWVNRWLDAQPYASKARSVSVSLNYDGDEAQVLFTPAPGTHRVRYKGKWFLINRSRDKPSNGGQVVESFTIKAFGRSPAPLRQLVLDAKDFVQKKDSAVSIYVSRKDYWSKAGTFTTRSLASVILPAGIAEDVAQDMREFLSSKKWYTERGIPWRRGYLFHGQPGTGKTSLIAALAGEIGFDIYVLNLSSKGLTDEGLLELLLQVPRKAVVLLEDVDAIVNGREITVREGDNASSVTFTGLLNALDGVASRPGQIVFMTTNHPEKLDPALVRPGRIDKQVEFKHATWQQVYDFFLHFYQSDDVALAGRFADSTTADRRPSMAEIQQHLLLHKHDPAAAVDSVLTSTNKR